MFRFLFFFSIVSVLFAGCAKKNCVYSSVLIAQEPPPYIASMMGDWNIAYSFDCEKGNTTPPNDSDYFIHFTDTNLLILNIHRDEIAATSSFKWKQYREHLSNCSLDTFYVFSTEIKTQQEEKEINARISWSGDTLMLNDKCDASHLVKRP